MRTCLLVLALGASAVAQETRRGRALVLRNARLYPVASAPIAKGDLFVAGGRIRSVGPPAPSRPGSREIEADGLTVIPALIDARTSAFLLDSDVSPETLETELSAADGLDPFHPDLLESFDAGVTTCFLAPKSRGVNGGRGVVFRLNPGGVPEPEPEGAAVCFSIGRPKGRVIASRDKYDAYRSIKKLFDDTKEYVETWKKYEEEKKDYEKKLKEWEEAKKSKKALPVESRPVERRPESAPAERRSGRRVELPPDFREWPREKRMEYLRKLQEERRAEQDRTTPEESSGGRDEEGKPRKPKKPEKNEAKEVLRSALDGKTQVRIEAWSRLDIELALKLADELALPVVLEGGTEASDLAPELAKRHVPVVLVPGPSLDRGDLPVRDRSPELAASLDRAGVKVAFASAGEGKRTPASLLLQAGLAVSAGMSEERAVRALTLNAAEILGLDSRLGSLESGKDADFIVLSGDPFDPATEVKYVVSGGDVKYPREQE